jgi:hypothetical protein
MSENVTNILEYLCWEKISLNLIFEFIIKFYHLVDNLEIRKIISQAIFVKMAINFPNTNHEEISSIGTFLINNLIESSRKVNYCKMFSDFTRIQNEVILKENKSPQITQMNFLPKQNTYKKHDTEIILKECSQLNEEIMNNLNDKEVSKSNLISNKSLQFPNKLDMVKPADEEKYLNLMKSDTKIPSISDFEASCNYTRNIIVENELTETIENKMSKHHSFKNMHQLIVPLDGDRQEANLLRDSNDPPLINDNIIYNMNSNNNLNNSKALNRSGSQSKLQLSYRTSSKKADGKTNPNPPKSSLKFSAFPYKNQQTSNLSSNSNIHDLIIPLGGGNSKEPIKSNFKQYSSNISTTNRATSTAKTSKNSIQQQTQVYKESSCLNSSGGNSSRNKVEKTKNSAYMSQAGMSSFSFKETLRSMSNGKNSQNN